MATFGYTTDGGNDLSNASDRAWISKFTAPAAGTIDYIWVYLRTSSAGGNIKGIVLADLVGTPTTLIAASASAAISGSAGWVQMAVSGSPSFTNGQVVWIGYVADSGIGNGSYGNVGGAILLQANGTYSYASPTIWPGASNTYSDLQVSAYIDYTASGGGSSILPILMAQYRSRKL